MASIAKPVLLAVIGILAVILFLQTSNLITGFQVQNETVTTLSGGSNVAPTCASGTWTAPTLVGCNNATVPVCYGTVTDTNGWQNITNIKAVLYSANAGGAGCTASQTNCYINASCANSSCSGTDCNATCTFAPMPWFVDNGTWTCRITPSDSVGQASTNCSTASAVAVLLSIDAGNTINFGAVAPSGNSGEITENIVNCGNTIIDLQVNGTAMTCTTNSIPLTDIFYGNATLGANTTLTGTLATMHHNSARASTYVTNATKDTFWWLQTVPGNIGGSCVGNVTFVTIFNTV
jgi:hypothetical protein